MSGSLNKVMLIGHLGKDPEIRTTQSGARLANFSMATSQSWKDKNTGERKELTQWHRIVVFSEGLVTLLDRYCKKGSKVYIEGQLETRKWTDNEGNDHYATEVVLRQYRSTLTLLDSRKDGANGDGQTYADDRRGSLKDREPPGTAPPPVSDYAADLDDDIPF